MGVNWQGVFPAVTAKFDSTHRLDLKAMDKHTQWQIAAGVDGIIVNGSLGENGVLSFDEKVEVLRSTVAAAGKVPVLCTVAETTTAEACRLAQAAAKHGAQGLMVLPGMRYISDTRETEVHFRTVAAASDLPIMVYNNPVAYGVDVTPEMFVRWADEPKFVAIKESSDDVRRVTDLKRLTGDRYRIFCGVDDLALEALLTGAVGWVAGLVCAFPAETVAIYRLLKAGRIDDALAIYRWFAPLLHLDVSTKLVQNIKLCEAKVGVGNEYVRAPRLPLHGEERARVEKIIDDALRNRPALPKL